LDQSKIDEIVEKIKGQISQGEYSAGQRLPSERDLAEQLSVSRATIRSVLSRLQAEGLIEIVPRGGAFVKSTKTVDVVSRGVEHQQFNTFMEHFHRQGKEVLVRFLEPSKIIPAGKDIGEKLNVSPETEVFRRYRVQIVDRFPYRIMEGYYLASIFRELCDRDQHLYPVQRWDDKYVPFFKWLREEKKIFPSKSKERLKCRMPNAEEAKILSISRNQPVVELHRWVWGRPDKAEEDILFEYSKIIYNASLHEFEYEFELGQG